MLPNKKLEEVLLAVPEDLKAHYRSLLEPQEEQAIEVTPFMTLSEFSAESLSMPPVITLSTGWKNLDYISAGGIAPGEVVLAAAFSGEGKTHFAVNLAINAARLGKRVFYLTVEDGWYQILQRFEKLDPEKKYQGMIFMMHEDELTIKNAIPILKRAIEDADLIIIDNLFALPLKQNAKGDYWTSQAEWVDDLCGMIRSSNCSALILHHLNKSKEGAQRHLIAGSTRLVNRVAQVWLLAQSKVDNTVTAIHSAKNRRSPNKGQCFLKSDPRGVLHVMDVAQDMREAAAELFTDML